MNCRISGIFNGSKLTLITAGPLACLVCGHDGGWHSIFDALISFAILGAIGGFLFPEEANRPLRKLPHARTMAVIALAILGLALVLVKQSPEREDENVDLSDLSAQEPVPNPRESTAADEGLFSLTDVKRWVLRVSGIDDSRYTDAQIEALSDAQLRDPKKYLR